MEAMFRRSQPMRKVWLVPLVLLACACESLWGRFNTPHKGGDLGDLALAMDGGSDGSGSSAKQIDVLFVIDNSAGMHAKQLLLNQNVSILLDSLDQAGVDYHVGVTSTDVGSFPPWASFPPPVSDFGCQSESGDDGVLQHVACTENPKVTGAAAADCATACPEPQYVPRGNFIEKTGGVTNVPSEFQPSQDGGPLVDRGPLRAFQCISMLGDAGCGIPGPLEAAKRALSGHNQQNDGFLRPRSILVVIFLTDQDDCSVALSQRWQNDPSTMDCPDAGSDAAYSCFNPPFRCLAMGMNCTEPMTTAGTKTDCQERTPSYLEPLTTYQDFFQALRPIPGGIVFGGIWAPVLGSQPSQFIVSQLDPSLGTAGLSGGQGPNASCYDSTSGIDARPQLRLTDFVIPFGNSFQMNVCAGSDYQDGLTNLVNRLGELLTEYEP
jgi:hypothetical protein